MKNRYLIFFSFIIAVAFLYGCSKDDESCPDCHELYMPPQLTPMKRDYRVGDTIVLALNTPFLQTHPEHYRPVDLSGFDPARVPLEFTYYELDANKIYYGRKSGFLVNQCELLTGVDKGFAGNYAEDMKYFLQEKKNGAYEFRIRIVLKREGYFSIGSLYGQYRIPKSPECFAVTFPFDTTRNNHFIRNVVGPVASSDWIEHFYFRVLP